MNDIRVALEYAAGVCLVFGVFWVWRSRKDRARGLVMAGAFAMMAGLLFGYASGWPTGVLIGLGVVLFLCLAGDVALRSLRKVEGDSGR